MKTQKSANKGDGRRVLRFEKELRQELASFFITGFRHDLAGIASITRVVATRDLKSARVYVGVMGSKAEQDESLETIQNHRVEFQNHVARTMNLRFCPLLSFLLDEAAEKVLNVERILHQLEIERRTPASDSNIGKSV